MDTFSGRDSWDHDKDQRETDGRKSYASPTLYVYGKLDDLTEYNGAVNSDGILGSSGSP
jgi:hypothetical protein